jgi:peptidoglycan biosynthesis protein MviN/MurJ (putative lipid II flippase)
VGRTTFANVLGRAANILIPLSVIGLYGADTHTDKFFFVLALSFYFYGTFSYAATESMVPLIIVSKSSLCSRGIVGIGLTTSIIVFIISLACSLLGCGVSIWYAAGLALMAGAGIANGFASGILHAGAKFSIPGLTWALRIVPLTLFALSKQPAKNLHYLALGIGMTDWLRLGLLLRLKSTFSKSIRLYGPLKFLKDHFPQYFPLALAMLIIGLNPIVDRLIAGLSGTGSISILDTGERLFGILATLCTLGMMTVLLTNLSKAVINGTLDKDWMPIIKMAGIWSGLWLAVGLLAGYLILGEWISNITSLNEAQILSVRKTYWYYLPGLAPYALCILYVKRLQAVQRTWTLAVTSSITVVFNIPASLALHHYMGVPGIALATSLVYAANSLMLVTAVHRKRWHRHGRSSH